MRALSWAILAPNPYKRQRWMVDLSQPDTAVLYVDPDRLLPHTNPFNSQIIIGLGCFLEVLRTVALQDGLNVDCDLFPTFPIRMPWIGAPLKSVALRKAWRHPIHFLLMCPAADR